MPRPLVSLKTRPSRDGQSFVYMLHYVNENGQRMRISLGHADMRKAEQQRTQKERELHMGIVAPRSMRLTDFLADSLARTGDQIRESTRFEYDADMKDFIASVGNIDYQKVTQQHGESFRQMCFDRGNAAATVAKKLRHVKRFFQLAVERGQLDRNPMRFVKPPRVAKGKVRVYSSGETERLLREAKDFSADSAVTWDILLSAALITGMRRGELLNSTWRDVNFAEMTIEVSPKDDTEETWAWQIKDAERRTLPLTEELTTMLAALQAKQPEGHPYIFVPPDEYARIQGLRRDGLWTYSRSRLGVIKTFDHEFSQILKRSSIEGKTFHDLRRTCLSNWLASGMSEHDIMTLAGHSSFSTTHQFYLAVRRDVVDRARKAAGFWHALGTRPVFSTQAVDSDGEKLCNGQDLGIVRP